MTFVKNIFVERTLFEFANFFISILHTLFSKYYNYTSNITCLFHFLIITIYTFNCSLISFFVFLIIITKLINLRDIDANNSREKINVTSFLSISNDFFTRFSHRYQIKSIN